MSVITRTGDFSHPRNGGVTPPKFLASFTQRGDGSGAVTLYGLRTSPPGDRPPNLTRSRAWNRIRVGGGGRIPTALPTGRGAGAKKFREIFPPTDTFSLLERVP